MIDAPSALELRTWALQCAQQAERLTRADERARLLKMRESLLALAENADWLAGRRGYVPRLQSIDGHLSES